jgi:hypothetical protein
MTKSSLETGDFLLLDRDDLALHSGMTTNSLSLKPCRWPAAFNVLAAEALFPFWTFTTGAACRRGSRGWRKGRERSDRNLAWVRRRR